MLTAFVLFEPSPPRCPATQDPFAWLQGLRLQASGSYEPALLAYNAFLAAPQAGSSSSGSSGSSGTGSSTGQPQPQQQAAALELAAAAQGFVVERVAECYAALADWSGLQVRPVVIMNCAPA